MEILDAMVEILYMVLLMFKKMALQPKQIIHLKLKIKLATHLKQLKK